MLFRSATIISGVFSLSTGLFKIYFFPEMALPDRLFFVACRIFIFIFVQIVLSFFFVLEVVVFFDKTQEKPHFFRLDLSTSHAFLPSGFCSSFFDFLWNYGIICFVRPIKCMIFPIPVRVFPMRNQIRIYWSYGLCFLKKIKLV